MECYAYSRITREYTGAVTVEPDEAAGEEGVYIAPAFTVNFAPPETGEHEVAVISIDGTEWEVHPDYRNAELYDTATGDKISVTAIGEITGALTLSAPPEGGVSHYVKGKWVTDPERVAAKLSAAKEEKETEIESARDAACVVNVTAHDRTWQADGRSQGLLGDAITLAQAGVPLPPVWRDADNNDMAITDIAQLVAIAGAIAQQTQTAYAVSWQLKAQVKKAGDIEQLAQIRWPEAT